MNLFLSLIKILNHPLNKNTKLKTLFILIWWKINQIFFKIPSIIKMSNKAMLICYPNSSYGSYVVYAKLPEFDEMSFLIETIKNGDVIIDVGANIGVMTILSASKGDRVQVFSFEPTEKLIPLINDNININRFNNRVRVIQKAVSNINGKINFILEEESEINHISTIKNSKNSIRVDSITLDKFVKDEGISRVNFLKIDVEGAEPLVLEGSRILFSQKKVEIILFEVNKNISNFNYDEKKLIDFLLRNNFLVYKFRNGKLLLINNEFKTNKTTNLIAVLNNKRVLKKISHFL